MYVKHSVHIDQPIKECSDALMSGPSKWFPKLSRSGQGSVGLHVAGVPIHKRVTVEVGEPVRTSTWAEIPLTWKATFPEKLFPVMTGKVDLTPVDNNVTRLTVSGMYEPPLGRLGKQLDDALMHSAAEATVKELAESIAQRLDKAVATRRGK
jgi:hypothetical protein